MTMCDMYQSQYDAAKTARNNAKMGSVERDIAQVELNDCRSALKRMIKQGWNLTL